MSYNRRESCFRPCLLGALLGLAALFLFAPAALAQTEYPEEDTVARAAIPRIAEGPGALKMLGAGLAPLDTVLARAEREGRLFNIYYASLVDIPGGKAVYIPIVPGKKAGTHARIDKLPENSETLMGVLVDNDGIALEFLTRTGEKKYRTRIVTLTGQLLYAGTGKMTVKSEKTGSGSIHFEPDLPTMEQGRAVWPTEPRDRPFVAWGLIYYAKK